MKKSQSKEIANPAVFPRITFHPYDVRISQGKYDPMLSGVDEKVLLPITRKIELMKERLQLPPNYSIHNEFQLLPERFLFSWWFIFLIQCLFIIVDRSPGFMIQQIEARCLGPKKTDLTRSDFIQENLWHEISIIQTLMSHATGATPLISSMLLRYAEWYRCLQHWEIKLTLNQFLFVNAVKKLISWR